MSEQNARIERWEWAALLAILAAFVLIRLPLYSDPGLVLGWNSDAALFGMMGRAMSDGSDFPLYFWGQFYMGTVTSMLTAVVGRILGDIGPLALRIAAGLEVALASLLYWLGLRRAFGRVSILALFWLAAGPSFLFHFTVAPNSEQLYLAAGVLFWYATRVRFATAIEWAILGVLAGLSAWLHQGAVFVCLAIGVALLVERALRLRYAAAFAAGLILGYVPAVLARMRDEPLLYSRTRLDWSLVEVFGNFAEAVRSDLWLLFADATPAGIAASLAVIGFAIVGLRREPWTRAKIVIVATIAASAAFWLFTTYGYPGAVRYIVPVVPLAYGAAAAGLAKSNRIAATVVAIGITLMLFVPRIQQANDVAAGRSELYTNWPGSFDPRPTLATLRAGGYRVCYGEVWVAHKLEWISSPTVRFVPVRSVHRTLKRSLVLIREPGRKCFVDNFGNVTTLSPEEEARWAASVVERARKAGLVAN